MAHRTAAQNAIRALCARFGCLICALLVATSAHALPSTSSAPHLTVGLVSEHAAITPGQDFWIGVNFSLEPGWHVYWVNPGDSGEPPRVAWKLPAGFHAGAIQWPRPERIMVPPLVDYGYHGAVLLMARIHAAPDAPTGKPAELAADVSWVVCREVCIPGKAQLGRSLPVTRHAEINARQHAVFEATRRLLPKPAPAGWKTTARLEGDQFVITVENGHPTRPADFFPLAGQQIANAAPKRVEAFDRGVRIVVKTAEHLLRTPATLAGVLVLARGASYVIEAPIMPTAAPPSGDPRSSDPSRQ